MKKDFDFFATLCAVSFQLIDKRPEVIKHIPEGYFLLRGLHHSYLTKIKRKYPIRKNLIYYETYVERYYPNDDKGEHLGERHNITLPKGKERKVVKILSH